MNKLKDEAIEELLRDFKIDRKLEIATAAGTFVGYMTEPFAIYAVTLYVYDRDKSLRYISIPWDQIVAVIDLRDADGDPIYHRSKE